MVAVPVVVATGSVVLIVSVSCVQSSGLGANVDPLKHSPKHAGSILGFSCASEHCLLLQQPSLAVAFNHQ